MSFLKLTFKPGINRDQTDYSGEGGWFICDRIRFYLGNPQTLGGWVKTIPQFFYGITRQFHDWITSPYGENLLAFGTNVKLYFEAGGNLYDITPLRVVDPVESTPNTDNSISTVIGTNVVMVTLPGGHAADTGSFVTIAGVAGPVGGIPAAEINGNHQITKIDALSFTFLTPTVATATVPAGGGVAITISFEIPPGLPYNTYGYGWGVGTWGRNGWGTGADVPILLRQRDWWHDNFNNDLISNIRRGPIYYWTRGTLLNPIPPTRAVLLSSLALANGFDPDAVPSAAMQIVFSQQDKHLIAFGAVPFGQTDPSTLDPLLIRWADQDNPFQWTPEVLNSAGFLRVSRGSRIVRALPTRQEILVWTDERLFTLQFLGTTDVFGLQEYADNISIIGPRAVVTASNVTYWMGHDKFYAYTGRVETLPTTLRDHIFLNLNKDQAEGVVCGTDEDWNEVWWFYPSAGALYNDSYVIYNTLERVWAYGRMERTAWFDTPLQAGPQAARPFISSGIPLVMDGQPLSYLMTHEIGNDDDGLPMNSFIHSNDFDLGDGDQFTLTRRLLPDIAFTGSDNLTPEVMMELFPRSFPGSAPFPDVEDAQRVVAQTGNVDRYTDQVFMRARARQMAFKVASANQLGIRWSLGTCRLDVRQDGRR